ncbi:MULTISPECIES: hypothetical protein [Aeromonas]|uniref:hypothetical protein n=1 Tax=Aeromonas TaxID=642 RepID=UPI0029DE5797|nr:hypothetical protein [Aeromonas caviae]MDX7645112.1 hypothetical protein [Aeromonas caviae]
MDFSVKGRRLDAAQKRMGEKEKKTLLFQQLLKKKSNKTNITLVESINAVSTAPEKNISIPPVSEITSWYGEANVSVYREDDTAPSTPGVGLIELINLYLSAAQNRTRHIVLMWPVCPKTLAVVHALATLERWARGDKLGVRGLVFPTKTNAFYPLNHLMLGREDVLRHARQLAEVGGVDTSKLKRRCSDKDAFLFSLASQSAEGDHIHPTMGELIPHFLATPGDLLWGSCESHLLEHVRAKLARRSHKKALASNCQFMGNAQTAPDALFALDGRLTREELRTALVRLKKMGPPEVVIVNATRQIRMEARGWRGALCRFLVMLEEVFGANRPGVLVVIDHPRSAYTLKNDLWRLNHERKELRWSRPDDYAITGIASALKEDGLVAPGQTEIRAPIPRTLDVSVVDADAAKVINKLYRLAGQIPNSQELAKPVWDAANYLVRLAALPCGVATLVEWLGESGIRDRTREAYSWSSFHAKLVTFDMTAEADFERIELRKCMQMGTQLYENYQQGTPLAHRLAEIVGQVCGKQRKSLIVVFTSPIYRRLAERYLAAYRDYPQGIQFGDFQERLRLISSSQLETTLAHLNGAHLVFSGLDEDGLRLVITDDQIPAHTELLLTQRNGQSLRNTLKPLVQEFPAFRQWKPRMESILHRLKHLPEGNQLLMNADFVLPAFRIDLSAEVEATEDANDPEAWSIRLEFGAVLHRRSTHDVYVYDPASADATDRGFRSCKVQSLEPGDKLFVMTAELRELVEVVLKEAGIPIEHDKTFEGALRDYHQSILKALKTKFPGTKLADQVRQLRASILEVNEKLAKDFPAEQSVRHWVNLGDSPDTPFDALRPQAPMKEAHFAAFADALGFSKLEVAYYWRRVIMPVRNARRLDGRHVSDLYTHMLLQPESVMVHSGIKRETIKMLFNKARENIVTVESICPPVGETTNA